MYLPERMNLEIFYKYIYLSYLYILFALYGNSNILHLYLQLVLLFLAVFLYLLIELGAALLGADPLDQLVGEAL